MNGNRQMVPVDYFFNNDLKYLQGGISTMTYTTSTTKTKATHYDLQGTEDMVPNIWSPVKVAFDKYALWGISHWRQQRKTFYGYARGLESSHDVYSTKCILVVTWVEVMQKHGYGYLREIEVRRADNDLYIFKLMRSDELYKFSDGTLTRLQTSLDDITKNIQMEYMPKRRWSSLENKRAHIMIKGIDKLQKERRMMRSLEKFVGGRHYKTDLRMSYCVRHYKTKKQQQYEHVGPNVTSAQDGDRFTMRILRLCLVDDLKEAQVRIQVKPIKTSSSLKSKITMPYSQDEVKKTNLRAQD
ncbi:hypothetical protein Tco_0874311 [Tanacetum coccineum]|uniref:Uncharacterized protein n=1 Tax=Tanacetum coccineum TaxID=301880 RepID=A0ABQ5BLA0_9ASTR